VVNGVLSHLRHDKGDEMSEAGDTPQDDLTEEPGAEVEDLEVSREEADAVTGGAVSSESPSGKRFGA